MVLKHLTAAALKYATKGSGVHYVAMTGNWKPLRCYAVSSDMKTLNWISLYTTWTSTFQWKYMTWSWAQCGLIVTDAVAMKKLYPSAISDRNGFVAMTMLNLSAKLTMFLLMVSGFDLSSKSIGRRA